MTGAQDPPALAAAALPIDCTEAQAIKALEAAGGDPGDPMQLALVFSELAVRRGVLSGRYAANNLSRTPPEPHVLQTVYEATTWPLAHLAAILGWKKVTVQTYTSGRIKKPLSRGELDRVAEALAEHAQDVDQARQVVAAEIERTRI